MGSRALNLAMGVAGRETAQPKRSTKHERIAYSAQSKRPRRFRRSLFLETKPDLRFLLTAQRPSQTNQSRS